MEIHSSLNHVIDKLEEFPTGGSSGRNDYMIYKLDRLEINNVREFSYCQFERKIFLPNTDHLIFSHCVFTSGFRCSNRIGSVTFNSCVFIHDILNQENDRSEVSFHFHDCDFEQNKQIVIQTGALELQNCNIDNIEVVQRTKSITISRNSKVRRLIILESCDNMHSLKISESNVDFLIYNPKQISSSQIDFDSGSTSTSLSIQNPPRISRFNGIIAKQVLIHNFQNMGEIIFSNCKVDNLEIESIPSGMPGKISLVDNEISELSLSAIGDLVKITLSRLFKLKKLDLFLIKTQDVLISEIQLEKINISKTDFDAWQIGYVDWGKSFKVGLSKYGDDNDLMISRFLELMEINRRFKQYFKNRDSPIDAAIFQRNELQAYLRYLLHKWDHLSFSQFFDLTLLGTNRIFSNFGQSFVLPLLWLLSIHFYLFYLLNQNYQLGYDLCFDWDSGCSFSKEAFGYYLHLINPVHKLVDVNGESVIAVEDFIMRISSGYFIFYFLKATRKFSK